MSYCEKVIQAGPGGMRDVVNEALAACADDLAPIIEKWYGERGEDLIFLTASMEMAVPNLKQMMGEKGRELTDSIVRHTTAMLTTLNQ